MNARLFGEGFGLDHLFVADRRPGAANLSGAWFSSAGAYSAARVRSAPVIASSEVEIGSVKMEARELDIRIINDKRMREQKVWRYKYEVLPSDSPCSGKVDVIFSEYLLRAHHSYRVRVCADQDNPEIIEVIKDIEPSGGEE